MPRRYSDYPDAITFWNTISTLGSIIAFISLLLFIVILWEALAAQRSVIARPHIPSSIEWNDILPLDFHNLRETGVITYP
jgi:cytochrome c oxidase subunit 1